MKKAIGLLAAATVLTALPSVAQAFDGWRDRGTFGAWTVICDELDDMGGVTITACAARAEPGLVFGLKDGSVFAALPDAAAGDTLSIGDQTIQLHSCPNGRCATGQGEAALLSTQAEIMLLRGGTAATISLAGLSDALAEGVRLVD